jgi:peptidoglycan/xylan/chitin deacetylase (PgdA/CDA1 family)
MRHVCRTVAILGYHKIGEPPTSGWTSWFYVPERAFVEQLTILRDGGWELIDLDRFLTGLSEPEVLPERAALLTFDDGYRSMHTVTLPRLREFAAPAVMFVPTDHVGGRNVFDAGVEPEEQLCDWEELRDLAANGVAIQSHAASHRRFSELSSGDRRAELLRSRRVIEDRLGVTVSALAFPYGDAGPEPGDALSECGYRVAFLYGGGPVRLPGADPFRVQRLAMGPDTDLLEELA